MKKYLLIVVAILAINKVSAQYTKERAIDASIGIGISMPYDEVELYGTGFYLQGEYVVGLYKWLQVRPYAGLILTKAADEDLAQGYQSTTKAFLIGGKARLMAPIPWVAPYAELGVGASIGSFKNQTPYVNYSDRGMVMHYPFTIGLALGREHNFNVEFTYYFHNKIEQVVGAMAVGLSIPLN